MSEPEAPTAVAEEEEQEQGTSTATATLARPWRATLRDLAPEGRYVVLCCVVAGLMLSHVMKRRWGGGLDIWEHAAAVRELAAHPIHPHHPLFLIDRPYQLFSPYLFAVALFARLSGISVTGAIDIAGLANLVLLMVSLHLFLHSLFDRRDVAFYALLFIIFLWGPGAWFFSAFLHFDVLALVLPYPATFAKAAVLTCFWLQTEFVKTTKTKFLWPMMLLSSAIILTHPADAPFLYIGLFSLALGLRPRRLWWTVGVSGAVVAASVILALLWPYFSLYDLMLSPKNFSYREAIASADHDMYVNVFGRIFPALIAAPFILRRAWRNWMDPLVLMFGGLLVGYLYGWRSEQWAYGRLISALMVVGAMILAEARAVVDTEVRAGGELLTATSRWVQVTTIGVVLLGAFNLRNGFYVLPESLTSKLPYQWVHSYVELIRLSEFDFLKKYSEHDVVLADPYTSMEVSAFGPKVVALARPEAFVDTRERAADHARFFTPTSTDADRQAIIRKYHVSLLLLTRERLAAAPASFQPLLRLGPTVFSSDRFVLVDVSPSRAAPAPGRPSPGR